MKWRVFTVGLCIVLTATAVSAAPLANPAPPDSPVKLIFIHHSTGGNWLADPNDGQPYGGLGQALMENNYFVSATNYGWGPEGIGDRTDIPNWPEWFLGPNRDLYLPALYIESGQNVGDFGDWSRLASDPGGENAVIMLKSCFPNSDLYGSPDDAPLDTPNDYDYTVANAKSVYIALLGYFETRPDKLFVVITAPPLLASDTAPDRAANARALNNWLVNDWLRDYPLANVAVFDYYNVLTAPDNHHRWNGSAIEHIQASDSNVSAYPSGDSHPSTEGDQKATAEFVPLLNVAYNRWRAEGIPARPPLTADVPKPATEDREEPGTAEAPETAELETGAPAPGGAVDDFEGDLEWYVDLGEGSTAECVADGDAHEGASALRMGYTIPEGGWAGCGQYYESPQNWSSGAGLSFWVRSDVPGQWITLLSYSGNADAGTPFEFGFAAPGEWTQLVIPWTDFARSSWADENGLAAFDPARVLSLAFSPGEGEGNLWVDGVTLVAAEPEAPQATAAKPVAGPTGQPLPAEDELTAEPASDAGSGKGGGLCGSAPLALLAVALVLRPKITPHRRK